jgi:methylenetetrahydrofolate--tRNA-(uracil-5-)-methyltransferase
MTPREENRVRIIGGGLAGCEAAWQLAISGIQVELWEMKPHKRTPAQVGDHLAELVCSNSFRSNQVGNAVGLIKEEMRLAGGFIMACAEKAKVPAGDALAVDREQFAALVESHLATNERITLVRQEAERLPQDEAPTIIATGPLTTEKLAEDIAKACGNDRLFFYDAIAPIVEHDSIDMEHAYFKSRWDKGDSSDYLNCPMTESEFAVFLEALLKADRIDAKDFEEAYAADAHYFEGCLPIEVMAERGPQTLTFGPMKPVGLHDPRTGNRPHAVLQLRKENIHGTAYNMVGCQTRLKQPSQREVFKLIPALREAKFFRYGAIHRNTYLDAPNVLDERFALSNANENHSPWYFAGQITGVEGYVESTACGMMVAAMVMDALANEPVDAPPETTMMGGLYRHVRGLIQADPKRGYQPSNVNWSMIPPIPLEGKQRKKSKKDKRAELSTRALADWKAWLAARQAKGLWGGVL